MLLVGFHKLIFFCLTNTEIKYYISFRLLQNLMIFFRTSVYFVILWTILNALELCWKAKKTTKIRDKRMWNIQTVLLKTTEIIMPYGNSFLYTFNSSVPGWKCISQHITTVVWLLFYSPYFLLPVIYQNCQFILKFMCKL